MALSYSERWLIQEPETQVIMFDVTATQGRILEIVTWPDNAQLQASPNAFSPVLVELESGTEIAHLAKFGNTRLFQTNTGLRGWITNVVEAASDEPAS